MYVFRRWWTHPSDFSWTTAYHRVNPLLTRAHIVVGMWCLLYAALCVLAAHTPAGLGDPADHTAGYALAGSAALVGAAWIRGPWPNETVSRLFVVYLEGSAGAALLMLTDPMVALPCAAAMGVNGSYVAAFHSPKLFLAHQGWALALSGVLFTRAVGAPDADVVLACAYLVLLTLVLFSAPILTQSLLLLLRRDAATAFFDPLTGLRNRRGVTAALTQELLQTASGMAAVLVIDLDQFKQVNDRFGHFHGDVVLRRTAEKIDAAFPAPAITARTGGEEFVVVTCAGFAAAVAAADALRSELTRTPDSKVTVSIGITEVPARTLAAGYTEAHKRADAAMYAAKRAGGNTIVIDSGAD